MSRFRRFSPLALIPLVTFGMAATPLHAYKMAYYGTTGQNTSYTPVDCNNAGGFGHWETGNISWYHNTANQGAGKATVIQNALSTWTSEPNADYVLTYAGTTSAVLNANDGQNTIFWGNPGCGTSCHALTAVFVGSNQEILGSDIIMNNSITFGSGYTGSCAATTTVDTQAVVTHELGHSLGIHHPATGGTFADATMGGSSCNVAGQTLHADDSAALQCLENRYPVNPSHEGYIDSATCRTITGWAWNANRPNQPVYLDLLNGSSFLSVLEANQYRADLVAAGKGNGYHGFSISTPVDFKTGDSEVVNLNYSGTSSQLVGSGAELYCGAPLFPASLVPTSTDNTGGVDYEVGTRFSSDRAGYVTHVGFYWGSGETGSHTVRLWTNSGTQLASAAVSQPAFGVGWTWAAVDDGVAPDGIPIQANVSYRVSVTTHTKQVKTYCGLSSQPKTGPLTAHEGFWVQGSGVFPTTASCSNFFVGVQFDV